MRHRRAHLGGADLLLRVVTVHEQAHVVVDAFQRGLPFAAGGGDGFFIVHIDAVASGNTRPACDTWRRCRHRQAQGLGDQLGVGAFAAGAGAVDGDDHRVIRSFLFLHSSMLNPQKVRPRPNFRPGVSHRESRRPGRGGPAASSFWKKFGNVFRTHPGFWILIPGTCNPENRKTHRHAVVIVGLDLRAVQHRRIDRERVALLDNLRAAARQFGSQGHQHARIPGGAAGPGR